MVLSIPLDLQKEEFPYLPDYTPSTDLMPRPQVVMPDPALVDEVVAMIAGAGHSPQRERPEVTLDVIAGFANRILRLHHEGDPS